MVDNQNQTGFLDTATSLGRTAYDITKTIAHAASGDFANAAITIAQSPLIRKIISSILVVILLFILIIGSMPSMIWNAINGGSEYSEVQLQILNMATQINGVFLDDYNIELEELKDMGISADNITTKESVPPISPYKIMSYFCATLLTPEGTEREDTELEEDTPSVVDGGIGVVVVPVGKGLVPKEGIFPQGHVPPLVLLPKSALLHALEKARVHLAHCLGKLLLQPFQTLTPPLNAPPGHPKTTPVLGRLGLVKQPYPPQSFAMYLFHLILGVGDGPPHRLGTDIQTNVIPLRHFSHFFLKLIDNLRPMHYTRGCLDYHL